MPRRRRLDPRGWSRGLHVLTVLAVLLAGYVTLSAAGKDTDCFPGLPRAVPDSAAPGDTVRITASAFPCDRGYHRGAFYGLEFRGSSSADGVDLGMFPVATDGSFDAEVTVPGDATAGSGSFVVTGFDIRDVVAEVCEDGSVACPPYAAGITVRE